MGKCKPEYTTRPWYEAEENLDQTDFTQNIIQPYKTTVEWTFGSRRSKIMQEMDKKKISDIQIALQSLMRL